MAAQPSSSPSRRRPSRGHSPAEEASHWELRFRTLVDWSLVAAIVLVPFSMGGLTALRYLTLAGTASMAAVSCGLWIVVRKRARCERSGGEWLIAAGIALLVAQMTPLSTEWIQKVSPRLAELMLVWSAATDEASTTHHFGEWSTLSLNPVATFRGLTSFVACAVLFQVASLRITRLEDAERLLKLIAGTTTAMAAFGLLQYFTSNGRFFWVFQHPQSSTDTYVKGAFPNRNHFANFMAMGLGPLLWWTLARSRGADATRRNAPGRPAYGSSSGDSLLLWSCVGVVIIAALLSLSRGGFLAMTAAVIVCVGLHSWAGLIPARVATMLVGCALAFGVVLAVFGLGKVEERLGTIATANVDQLDRHDARRTIWAANWRAAAAFPIAGLGAGTHRDVYRSFLETWFPRDFAYAESTFFQLGLETGYTGLVLTSLGVLLVVFRAMRSMVRSSSRQVKAAQAAVLAGVAAAVLHGFVDFVWYMPGCAVIVVVLAACALRVDRIDRHADHRLPERSPTPLVFRLALLAGSIVLSVWMVQSKIPALLAESHSNHHFVLTRTAATSTKMSIDLSRQRLEALIAAVKADPADGRLQLRLATECVLHFNNMQSQSANEMLLTSIRDTVANSGFSSSEELREWMGRVAGDNVRLLEGAVRHARKAVQLSPMLGRGYLVLSELAFLDSADESAEAASQLLSQARRCDATDGMVLIARGEFDWKNGDEEAAVALWKTAFHQDPFSRQRLLDCLCGSVDAEFFLSNFEPEWDHLLALRTQYERLQRVDQVAILQEQIAEAAEARAEERKGREAAEAWRIAGDAWLKIEQPDRARDCLIHAVEADENAFEARLFLGKFLLEQQDFATAAEHLQWCARRKPRDSRIKKLAEEATANRLRDPSLAERQSLYDWRRQQLAEAFEPEPETTPEAPKTSVGRTAAVFDDVPAAEPVGTGGPGEAEPSAGEAIPTSTVRASFDEPEQAAKPEPEVVKPGKPLRRPKSGTARVELTRPLIPIEE